MYIYYLLSFKPINEIRDDLHPIRPPDADNTFILALDGDVEFKPDAVHKLVDLMKKDKKVGAACGRIHPVGTGKQLAAHGLVKNTRSFPSNPSTIIWLW